MGEDAKCNIQICFHLWQSVNENKCVTAVRIPTKVIDENLGVHDVWEFRRKIKLLKRWCYRPLWEWHTKFTGFNRSLNTKWKSPPNELFSLGWAEMPCTRRSVSKQYKVVCTLKSKRTRTENLLILRWKKNRLSQVLNLFYSRISHKNFRFGMIYDCLFESVWFTFREQVAPAPSINLDKIKTFRLSASCHSCNEWQAAGSRRE